MKNRMQCTKCESSRVLKVKGQIQFDNIKVGMTPTSLIPVDRFVCLECGYTEEWIVEKEHLRLVEKYHGKDKIFYPWEKK